jgi:hypothetical protein
MKGGYSIGWYAARYALLDEVIEERYKLLAYHSFFPGLMNVIKVGINYQTLPVPYIGSPDSMSICFKDEIDDDDDDDDDHDDDEG